MKFLLDTNICIYIIKRKPPKVLDKFNSLEVSDIGISSITVAVEYGAYKSQARKQNYTALQQFLALLEIINFDATAAQIYAQIRGDLERQGQVIGSLDMLIAAQAIACEITLVTNNVKEFSRIPDLDLENWAE